MSTETKKPSRGVASHLAGLTAQLEGSPDGPGMPAIGMRRRGSAASSAPVALAAFSNDYQKLEQKVEELEAREGRPLVVEIVGLVYSPFHIGPIVESRVLGLVANLAENKLNSPIVVRRLADGALQVIAGRHRIEAYKRLGRTTIEAVLKEYTDEEVVALVFFDNLWAPVTPDYFKYLGFKQLQSQLNLSYSELATKSGISKTQVSRLLSFDKLPQEAHEIISANAEKFGANLAEKLAPLVADFAELIPRACSLVAAGELDQDLAADWVRDNVPGREHSQAKRAQAEKREISHEGRKYATLAIKGKKLTITLPNPDEIAAIESALTKVLQDRAAASSKLKSKKQR
ncbi:ParB/RepB/Spo0J family partition protein [Paucibacter soli]|uniref:ParB/RepB/Spo0J family partition protein n=1 Tax=Paucibacter soli TaxID=3133433 RepID=UPI00309706D4